MGDWGVVNMADEKKKVELGDYVEVSQRIVDARQLYPEGRFQPADPKRPYFLETIDGQSYIAYSAAFYRDPEDTMPGIGTAWELVPGKTPYTRGSELQNAETSAWGRALVAALVADTKRGIASADEIRIRTMSAAAQLPAADFARTELLRLMNQLGKSSKEASAKFAERNDGADLRHSDDAKAIQALLDDYRAGVA